MTALRKVWLLKSVTSASTHGFQKLCTVATVGGMLWGIAVPWNQGYVQIRRRDAAILMSFEVGEVALAVSKDR